MSQLSTSRLASPGGIADGSAVRGHAFSGGTAVTNGADAAGTRTRTAGTSAGPVTMQRSDGGRHFRRGRPNRYQSPSAVELGEHHLAFGRHIPRKPAIRRCTDLSSPAPVPAGSRTKPPKAASSSASASPGPARRRSPGARTPSARRWPTTALSERGDGVSSARHRQR